MDELQKELSVGVNYSPISDYLNDLISDPKLDIFELLARRATNTTVSDIILKTNPGIKDANTKKIVDSFIKSIYENNSPLFLIRGLEHQLSKLGVQYVWFEHYKGSDNKDRMYIGLAEPTPVNQSIRLNQQQEIACVIQRSLYNSKQFTRGVVLKELITPNYTTKLVFQGNSMDGAPADIFFFKLPEYVIANSRHNLISEKQFNGEEEINWKSYPAETHNYGVMSCKQFLNFGKLYFDLNPECYADSYPVTYLGHLINDYLKFLRDEPNLNFTTRIGRFSQQDIEFIDQVSSDWKTMTEYKNNKKLAKRNPLAAKMWTSSGGSEGNQVQIQQSTFNGTQFIEYLKKLIGEFMRGAGYTWYTDDQAVYRNQDAVQNINRLDYETTKEKLRQRHIDWYEVWGNALYVWAKKVYGYKDEQAQKLKENIRELVTFKIVSNLMNDHLKRMERVQDMVNLRAIDHETVVRDLNEDKTEDEIQKILSNVKQEDAEVRKLEQEAFKQHE